MQRFVTRPTNAQEIVRQGLCADLNAAGYTATPEPTLTHDFVLQYGMMHQYAVRARRVVD